MEQISGTTLYTFLEYCLKAVEIYDLRAEENGTGGDIESFEILNEESNKLKETIKRLRKEWRIVNFINFNTVRDWVETEISKEDRETIIDALNTVKIDREYKVNEHEEELEYLKKVMGKTHE